mmetsp:Transcript_5109/g.5238  ORF Transcript_5109/g.5238 Transcript_5109/m.5238 type:complete len:344 (-) Transcript_5109:45-1076(-)
MKEEEKNPSENNTVSEVCPRIDNDNHNLTENRTSAKGRPNISLDFIVKNERLAEGYYNDYIRSFCRDGNLLEKLSCTVESDPVILKLMNKQSLKKELTECYSAICLVERSLRRIQKCPINENTEEPLITFTSIRKNAKNLAIYDICSGKGILSFLLTLLFPEISIIKMIDSNKKIKLDHLDSKCCNNITYEHYDIFNEEFSDFLLKESEECTEIFFIPVIIGLHLCGNLSVRLVHLFNNIDNLPILIISPCCLPTKSKKNQGFMTRDKLKKNKWSSYDFWCMSIYMLIDHLSSVKNIVKDDLVESQKNTFIWAVKKKFLKESNNLEIENLNSDIFCIDIHSNS